MKFEFNKRFGKGLALVGTLALCLTLSGCYIPPDEIAAGTQNMTTGSNNVPFPTFDPIPTATATPTQAPTKAPTQAPSQPTINWDDWGTTATTNTPVPNLNTNAPIGGGTIVVVTQQPTDTPAPTAASLKKGASGSEGRQVQQRL